MDKQNLVILGSTGSIGESTLSVVRANSTFNVLALAGNTNVDVMLQQVIEFQPSVVCMVDGIAAKNLKKRLPQNCNSVEILTGTQSLIDIVQLNDVDIIVAGIVGVAGLASTIAATNSGKKVLLANKESLVCAGYLLMKSVRDNNAQLLPLDSEHNAIFQCLTQSMQQQTVKGHSIENDVERIILTASGGPLRQTPFAELAKVTPEIACAHPNWSMGQKISVDSATMMNKGLEYIEACWLFGLKPSSVDVIIHPQSVIHSLVEYTDGSLLAQLGLSDMKVPISYALGWPNRIDSNTPKFNLAEIANLNFESVDYNRFPCLRLAIDCMSEGQAACTIMNIANEIAVDAFLKGLIRFDEINYFVSKSLEMDNYGEPNSIESVIDLCNNARRYTASLIFDDI